MEIRNYLQKAVEDGASDLFIVAGSGVNYRLRGHLCPMDDERLLPPDTERLITVA